MELALQVVGLKMTGKIEDAKNVAMRIVGTSGQDGGGGGDGGGGDTSGMMQLSSSTSTSTSYRDIRPLLLTRAGDGENFESVIVDFLSVLDVDVAQTSQTQTTPTHSAISHTTPSGQTLLHLSCLLGFPALVQFLIEHGIDLDARDRNGYTALHFAAIAAVDGKAREEVRECARLLLGAGADLKVVNALGKTPVELGGGFFEDVVRSCCGAEEDESSSSVQDDDDESNWGDGEEDAAEEPVTVARRPPLSRTSTRRRTETPVNLPTEDIPSETPYPADDKKQHVDEKQQTASFVDMIQRTLAQLYAPHGIIPNMPQLPLPHLPEMPAVPWAALPQIPIVFPVFVPMPGWPSLRGDKHRENQDQHPTVGDIRDEREHPTSPPTGSSAIRAAQEWRATCEKWMALAMATAMRQDDAPPPMYTPRTMTPAPDPTTLVDDPQSIPTASFQSEPDDEGELSSATIRASQERPAALRRFGYPSVNITDQDVNAFGYQPAKSKALGLQNKGTFFLFFFRSSYLILSWYNSCVR
jgi:hypothetical protein